jgi:hypothetical protein
MNDAYIYIAYLITKRHSYVIMHMLINKFKLSLLFKISWTVYVSGITLRCFCYYI